MSDDVVQRRSGLVRSTLRLAMRLASGFFPREATLKQTRLDGSPLIVWANEYIGQRIITSGSFEREDLAVLPSLVNQGETCIDVGANIGIYSLALSRIVGTEGRVEAFEPVMRNALLTELNCELNGLQNVTVNRAPLSDKSGKSLKPQVPKGDSAYSYFTEDEAGGAGASVSLDDYLTANGIGDVHFIKIDVEGAEFTVLKGAERLLASDRRPRTIMVELVDEYLGRFSHSVTETCAWMAAFDYVPHGLRAGRLEPMSPGEIAVQNVFFICRPQAT